jgi:hypothetical protein
VKFLRSRRGMSFLAVLVLILFLFRPGVYRLRNRIATSIGGAIGRRVSIDKVRLHFLPRPGFDLQELVIYDDPEFSAEPMIHAQDVSAAIRLRSLFRGRLEIATLSATDPSINLVRNQYGGWNFASLLERNAQIPAAPTSTDKRAFERRPVFPYLEASHARINFKIGQTKKSYALMDADVALWQDSEDSWSARIKASPVRTDFNLTDTGTITVDGKWQRAPTLRSTPLQFTVQWQNGQLGQLTKLFSGKDRGWRGGINLEAHLDGTPQALAISSQTVVEGFRRYDIAGSENVRLAAACSGRYNVLAKSLTNLLCESPVGGGDVHVRGTAAVIAQVPTYDLTVGAANVPVASVMRLLRQAKKHIPIELGATGLLNAEFHATGALSKSTRHDPFPHLVQTWNGTGSATSVLLSSPSRDVNAAGNRIDEIAFASIPLALEGRSDSSIAARTSRAGEAQPADRERPQTNLRIGPVTLAMNAGTPFNAGGWISKEGYHFFVRGDAELRELFRLENVLGVSGFRPAAEGLAKVDLNVAGGWQGFAAPVTTGSALLRNVRAEVRGLNAPIEIKAASLTMGPDLISAQKILARIGDTQWSGRVTAPRHCAPPDIHASTPLLGNSISTSGCEFQFDLAADQLSSAALAEWFAPRPTVRPWYRILDSASNRGPHPLLSVKARGNLRVGRLILKNLTASQVATQFDTDRGKINLTGLRAQLLQGSHRGNWSIDLNQMDLNQPAAPVNGSNQNLAGVRFHGAGTLHAISLDQVSAGMNDDWITGTADGSFIFDGSDFRSLLTHSAGKLQFVARNGSLPHIEIPASSGPLPMRRFEGELNLKDGEWRLSATLESHDDNYKIGGTFAAGNFDIVLTSSTDQSWAVTGTLAEPRVAALDQAVAGRAETDTSVQKP